MAYSLKSKLKDFKSHVINSVSKKNPDLHVLRNKLGDMEHVELVKYLDSLRKAERLFRRASMERIARRIASSVS